MEKKNPFARNKQKSRVVALNELKEEEKKKKGQKKEEPPAKTTERDISEYFMKKSPVENQDMIPDNKGKAGKEEGAPAVKRPKVEEGEDRKGAEQMQDVKDAKGNLVFLAYEEGQDRDTLEKAAGMREKEINEGVANDMNASLADISKFVDEIKRSDVKIPEVKDPKMKELPKWANQFVRPDGVNIDMNRIHTLMSLLTNDDLIELFGAKYLDKYLALKRAYEEQVKKLQAAGHDEVKVSSGKFRKMLMELPSVIKAFMLNGKLTNKTWELYKLKVKKHNEKVMKNKELLKEKRRAAKLTAKPKRKFIGALLSKLTPDQYREAMQEYGEVKKGVRLHKYSNLTPGKMIKELERQAYAEQKNDGVAKILADADSYKADDISAGVKQRIKDIEARLANSSEEEKNRDPDYVKFVLPFKKYRTDESILISDIRSMIAKGAKPDAIKAKLKA